MKSTQESRIRRLRKKYVRTLKFDHKWHTYLQIDHQGFCIVEKTSRIRAQWFGKMMATALERLVEDNFK